jgi:hypothetical protein
LIAVTTSACLQGELQAALAAKDVALTRSTRATDDLKANVDMLHARLDQAHANLAQVCQPVYALSKRALGQQAASMMCNLNLNIGIASYAVITTFGLVCPLQVDTLRGRLNSVMAAVDVPQLMPGHTSHTTTTSQPAAALLQGLVGHTGAGVAVTNSSQGSTAKTLSLSAPSAPMQPNPSQLDSELERSVAQAVDQVQAAVAGGALLEVAHWELECGLQVGEYALTLLNWSQEDLIKQCIASLATVHSEYCKLDGCNKKSSRVLPGMC